MWSIISNISSIVTCIAFLLYLAGHIWIVIKNKDNICTKIIIIHWGETFSMKSVGICRVDKMGRFVIPKRLRREMDLNTGTGLEISVNGNSVILEKVENRCVFCRQKENLKIAFDKYYVCDKCRYILKCILE